MIIESVLVSSLFSLTSQTATTCVHLTWLTTLHDLFRENQEMDHQVKKETLYVHLMLFAKSFEITDTFKVSFWFSYIYLKPMYVFQTGKCRNWRKHWRSRTTGYKSKPAVHSSWKNIVYLFRYISYSFVTPMCFCDNAAIYCMFPSIKQFSCFRVLKETQENLDPQVIQ